MDPDRCVGCGLCETVCPETVPDCFNEGLSTHKAIYLPVPHAIPNPYVIDLAACTRCGACADICPTDAVLLAGADRKNFTILVVDDELSIRDSLKEWLEEEGFSVDMAASGAEALEKLKARPFHLMLTDIKMPEMSGTDLLHAAKAAHPDLCVVMMTAYATVETAVEAMKTGAEDYLIKPFEPETLLPMVIRLYQDLEAARDREITAETIILGTGTSFYDPADKK
ncbi:MAG: response regulator, partial [Desulfobacterales bacterium]